MRKFVLSMVALCVLMSTPAFAMKIGVIDLRELGQNSEPAKIAAKKLTADFEPEGKEIKKLYTELTKKIEEMKVQQSMLSPEAKEDKRVEIVRMQRDFEDKKRAYTRKFNAANTRVRKDITLLIFKATDEYGKKNGYDLILDDLPPAVIFSSDAIDVTKEVMVELNRIFRAGEKK